MKNRNERSTLNCVGGGGSRFADTNHGASLHLSLTSMATSCSTKSTVKFLVPSMYARKVREVIVKHTGQWSCPFAHGSKRICKLCWAGQHKLGHLNSDFSFMCLWCCLNMSAMSTEPSFSWLVVWKGQCHRERHMKFQPPAPTFRPLYPNFLIIRDKELVLGCVLLIKLLLPVPNEVRCCHSPWPSLWACRSSCRSCHWPRSWLSALTPRAHQSWLGWCQSGKCCEDSPCNLRASKSPSLWRPYWQTPEYSLNLWAVITRLPDSMTFWIL